MRALSGGGRPWLKARAGALVMLLKFSPPVVYFSRAAAASTAARTFFSRGGDFGPEHSNCCSKAAFFPSVTVVVMAVDSLSDTRPLCVRAKLQALKLE